jgi:peroxiredoxin
VFADTDGLNFPLLSDFWPHGAVATAYGVFDAERGVASRSSFVVDKAGIIRWAVHNEMVDERDLDEHVAQLHQLD